MPIDDKKIITFSKDISDLADKPVGFSPAQIKAQFDAAPNELRLALNGLIDILAGITTDDSGADNIGATALNAQSGERVQSILEYLFAQIQGVSQGAVPDDSVAELKLTQELRDKINKTAQQLLDQIKSVDGAGSGLDSDLLRGKPASDYHLEESARAGIVGVFTHTAGDNQNICIQDGYAYGLSSGSGQFSRINLATGVATALAALNLQVWNIKPNPINNDEIYAIVNDGTTGYLILYKYTISANTWTNIRRSAIRFTTTTSYLAIDLAFTKDGSKLATVMVTSDGLATPAMSVGIEVLSFPSLGVVSSVSGATLGTSGTANVLFAGSLFYDEVTNVWRVVGTSSGKTINNPTNYDLVLKITDTATTATLTRESWGVNVYGEHQGGMQIPALVDMIRNKMVYLTHKKDINLMNVFVSNNVSASNPTLTSHFLMNRPNGTTYNYHKNACLHDGFLYYTPVEDYFRLYRIRVYL